MGKWPKILLLLFFAVAFAVHIYVPLWQPSSETNLSHVIHLLSYGTCFAALASSINNRLYLFALAALYPFGFHLNCALQSAVVKQSFNPICWLVVLILPLVIGLIWKKIV